ncbi:MAG: hypothetical protein JWM50_2638 [Microbacteriaceae bacterium]|jgi:hypothetical protein|nr:hypothetical protein [Microbacteriaceae bacterium]
MAKKLWIAVGFAAGYVLGSAAGRAQYERIRSTAKDLWERPEVQRTVKKVDDFVGDKVPVVHDLGAALVESVNEPGDETSGDSAPKPTPPSRETAGPDGTPGATS